MRFKEFFAKYGLDIFLFVLLMFAAFSLFFNVGMILKILLAGFMGYAVLLLFGKDLEEVFNKYGLGDYYRTITVLAFVVISLWNWLAVLVLLAILLFWYISKQ